MQREQQKQRAEELLQQDIDVELTQEEIDEKAQRRGGQTTMGTML